MMLKFTNERFEPLWIRHDHIVYFKDGQYGNRPTSVCTQAGEWYAVLEKSAEIAKMIDDAERTSLAPSSREASEK